MTSAQAKGPGAARPTTGRVRPMAATSHNIYFDGGVQSLGFEPDGPRAIGRGDPARHLPSSAPPPPSA